MPSQNPLDEGLIQCRNRWLQVCRSRGTPAPDQTQVNRFLANLPAQEQAELDQALLMCLNGREKHRELALISWAAACTRPEFLAQKVMVHGLACTGSALFGAGLTLMASGWDMSARIAQLANNPQDIATLQTLLAPLAPLAATSSPAPVAVEAIETPALSAATARMPGIIPAVAVFPPPVQAPRPAPAFRPISVPMPVPMPPPQSMPAPVLPPEQELEPEPVPEPPATEILSSAAKSSRLKRQGLAPVQHLFPEEPPASMLPEPQDLDDPELGALSLPGRLQVRLFGRESAHTLEVGPHRRGASFMGVQVVTIESARALPDASGYDWSHKLMVQLTPEEMPQAMAVLMNLSASARFGQHGPDRDKFVELRRQEGGLVVVTGQGGAVYAVPVKTGSLYYVLALFSRAMARGLPGSSVAEVLALVKAAHS